MTIHLTYQPRSPLARIKNLPMVHIRTHDHIQSLAFLLLTRSILIDLDVLLLQSEQILIHMRSIYQQVPLTKEYSRAARGEIFFPENAFRPEEASGKGMSDSGVPGAKVPELPFIGGPWLLDHLVLSALNLAQRR